MGSGMPFPDTALVIREPWIGLILRGRKAWEMRSRPTRIRGTIGLVRAKSGLIVGVADLVDSLSPLNRVNYMSHSDRHAIPASMLDDVMANGWVYPWVLANVRPLPSPVPYRHKSGAVTFVTLEREEVEAAAHQIGVPLKRIQAGGILPFGAAPVADRSVKEIASLAPTTASASVGRVSSKPKPQPAGSVPATLLTESCSSTHPVSAGHAITLTGGAIRNGNLTLNSMRHLIPAGGVGGTNKDDLGRSFIARFDPGGEHETDVAGDKMLLRCRGAVRYFFSQAGAQEGDIVRVDAQDTRTLVFTLQRR